ncbi:MAG: 4Fe-4S dicluster domain-containing protein, partial [Bdellovibrionales bacterium]|nr:4Fe-4S dicluster domain-containing protein [Bdellovibrionales bacterium]
FAKRHALADGDIIELAGSHGRSVQAPICVVSGMADHTISLSLGYGRIYDGEVLGADAYPLQSHAALWEAAVAIRKTGKTQPLARTQEHYHTHDRHVARSVPASALLHSQPLFEEIPTPVEPEESLYPPKSPTGPQWGMVIDGNACIGCNACITACQAENNTPSVGYEEVLRGREMHWIRVDEYHEAATGSAGRRFQPIPCMHCENAPCELVCPVAATVHSHSGLNQMVYNRCVGTRFCSNNCPYKVRRFNFHHYTDSVTPLLAMLQNPDVTVRARGVMEKCSYCVQRINRARIDAKTESRDLREGEVETACQEACPTQAIHFGDLAKANSSVSILRRSPRHYGLLTELNTRPRTTYLAHVRNDSTENGA